MKDGEYTVRKIEKGKRKGESKVLLKGVQKNDYIWSTESSLREGSIVTVRGRRIKSIKND